MVSKKKFADAIVGMDTSIYECIEVINESGLMIALVVDQNNQFVGTVTDGDIRRGILNKLPLEEKVSKVMNPDPIFSYSTDSRQDLLGKMKKLGIFQMPILDTNREIIDLIVVDNIEPVELDIPVVLMVGGLGSRLKELTENCPKPLLKVGEKPILERILDRFIEQGFRTFHLCVNFKSEMIQNYFKDGREKGVEINYLKEYKKMGTAGALSFLKGKIQGPFIVMNGDLLTNINFEQLIQFHADSEALGTMCVREYDFQVPFGVVKTHETKITQIVEKPVHKFFVNAGIYVLDQKALEFVPDDSHYDMTSLFDDMIQKDRLTNVFPIHEYWLDIGRKDDFSKANSDIEEISK